MFETTQPFSEAQTARVGARFAGRIRREEAPKNDLQVGGADSAAGEAVSADDVRSGDVLRVIEWSELTARLNAARDLRLVLGRDAKSNIEAEGGSFADAAARYFRTKDSIDFEKDREKPDVNPVALEHRKGSPGMIHKYDGLDTKKAQIQGHAVNGDAREI